jgi:polysaccharide deacetylase family protein (PEP-CTERM system associated)
MADKLPSRSSAPRGQPAGQIANALTVDVEDYFQVAAFERIIQFCDWERYESRVCQNTDRLLDLFSEHQVLGTFFVLGWVAKQHPHLLRRIRERGHEIACHGYRHVRINLQDSKTFREDIRQAKKIIEQEIGDRIRGYRAATFSVRPDTLWALEILVEEGFDYDSSIFPIAHDRYGIPTAPRFPFKLATPSGTIAEFPISTIKLCGQNVPATGGGYFRILPFRHVTRAIRELNQTEGMPAVFYLHPWEIDTEQPRQTTAAWREQFRHYTNIHKTESRLRVLLKEFRFASMVQVLRECPLRTFDIQSESLNGQYFASAEKSITFFDGAVPKFRAQKISVVIPVYNESENLEPLCLELRRALSPLGLETEWIFVDDGSTDDSLERLRALRNEFHEIKIVKLRRNFGQTAAMQAGFDLARGDVVVSMDADLQNDPGDIPMMLRRLEAGYDLVCGWRKDRRDPWLSRKLPSKVANWMIRKVIGSEIHDRGCSLKVYRAELVRAFRLYSDMHRFIQEVSSMSGARVSELVVNHRDRRFGASKYGISRTFRVLSDMCSLKLITRYGSKPTVGFFALAIPFGCLGLFSFSLALVQLFSSADHVPIVYPGIALICLSAFCFVLLLGFVGEMMLGSAGANLQRAKWLIPVENEDR